MSAVIDNSLRLRLGLMAPTAIWSSLLMNSESAAMLAAFWSWVAGISAVVLLGLLLPATVGGMTGLLPLLIRRKDWRSLPELGLVCVLFAAPGVFVLAFVRQGVPALDFWLVLIMQIAGLTFAVTTLFALDLSIKRIRRDRQALEAVRSFVPEQGGPVESQRPTARKYLRAFEAEYYVAEWMRWLGAVESVVTRARRDGGVDVRSAYYVAQVKHRPTDFVSVTVLRELQGVASLENRNALFFTSGRYTTDARAFAARAGIALFIFRPADGRLISANAIAQRLHNDGLRASVPQPV